LLSAALEAFHRPLPPQRLGWIRIVVVGYALAYVSLLWPMFLEAPHLPLDEYRPVGIFFLYQAPLSEPTVHLILVGFFVVGVLAMAGWRFPVTGRAFALLTLVLLSYRNSWGYIQHAEKLPLIHVLILGFSPAADAVSLDARRRAGQGLPAARTAGCYGWPVRLMAWVTVMTYVLSAVTKLRYSGWAWIASDVVRNVVGWVALRNDVLGLPSSIVGPQLLQFPWLFNAIAALTVAIELGAPLAFVARCRTLWMMSAVLMHWGVLALMLIPFPYHLFGLAYLPFLEVEAWAGRVLALARPQRLTESYRLWR
jgi:hypothetical protein